MLKEENSTIKKEIADLKECIEFPSEKSDKVRWKVKDIDRRANGNKLKNKIIDFGDRSHQNNLHFDGFKEEAKESWETSEIIEKFL